MRPRTKLYILAAVLVVVAVGYTGAWYYFAGVLKARADGYIARLTGENIDAACHDLDVGGYPLNIGVRCDKVRANDKRNGAKVEAGAFRTDAQIDRPGHVVSSLSGPLRATGPNGMTVAANWKTMRSSTVVWTKGLLRGDLQATDFEATLDNVPYLHGPVHLASPEFEIHTRQNKADLDAAFTATKLAVNGSGRLADLPVADLSANVSFDGMARLLSGRRHLPEHPLRGQSGTLRSFTASLGDGAKLSLSGPFSVDEKGRLSGKFKLKVGNLQAWEQTVATVVPSLRKSIATAAGMLSALADKDGSTSLTLTADHGHLSLGLIPVGKLPPV